jgi:hypothetical protein
MTFALCKGMIRRMAIALALFGSCAIGFSQPMYVEGAPQPFYGYPAPLYYPDYAPNRESLPPVRVPHRWVPIRRTTTITNKTTVRYEADLVRKVQQELADLGYSVGEVDGELGPHTQSALKSFRKDHGIGEKLLIGDDTRTLLESLAENAAKDVNQDTASGQQDAVVVPDVKVADRAEKKAEEKISPEISSTAESSNDLQGIAPVSANPFYNLEISESNGKSAPAGDINVWFD